MIIKSLRRLFTFYLVFLFAAILGHAEQIVHVGYYPEPGMMNGAQPDGKKSGYAYEYLQEIASHAGWRYEYVYGRFDELYPKLKNGEIDLLPYVNYSEKRAKEIMFPELEMGAERFYLAAKKQGALDSELTQLAGKKVGTSRGTYDRTPFLELMKERKLAYTLVEFDSVTARWEALMSGEIDFSIETSAMHQSENVHAVYALPGEHPFHLAVAPGKYELLEQLNAAQQQLAYENPGFLNAIKFKYFNGVPLFKMLSREAEDWLKSRSAIRIGTFDRQAPFAYQDADGKISGIAPDSVSLMFSELGVDIPVEWKLYSDRKSLLKALKAGEIDLIHPYYHNYPDAEQDGVHEEKYEITEAFNSFEPAMAGLAASKDIDLRFSIGKIRDRFIFADGPRFDRGLINIISNAIKYTLPNGFVKVSVDQVEDTKQGYGNYRFIVADSGIGMSEEFQKHMFEDFTREESSTTSGIQGTGLGLSLAKKLVELMGGTISCASTQGVGTTFTIVFPFRLQTEKDMAERTASLQEHATVDFKGRKVLLVEDNELNREIAEEILSEKGVIVETAENGQIAVNKVRSCGDDYYDFILMDIQMPIMNGYEATKAIRNLMPELKTPIIALSANAFAEDKQKSLEAGMNDHVAKPINVKELESVLAKFL